MKNSSRRLARRYLTSAIRSLGSQADFTEIERFCMFIGFPRSGHSVVGALLDAHPEAIVSHELNALKYLRTGFSRRQIYYLIREKSRRRAAMHHAYVVPNQWQGRFRTLRVIGDNKGGVSNYLVRHNPELIDRLPSVLGIDVKMIHVVRNPYDNISSIYKMVGASTERQLAAIADQYFTQCETMVSVSERLDPGALFEMRHESFVGDPRAKLSELCQFLRIGASDEYLDDSAAIVFSSPHASRYNVPWAPELIERVQGTLDVFPFLRGYSYDDQPAHV